MIICNITTYSLVCSEIKKHITLHNHCLCPLSLEFVFTQYLSFEFYVCICLITFLFVPLFSHLLIFLSVFLYLFICFHSPTSFLYSPRPPVPRCLSISSYPVATRVWLPGATSTVAISTAETSGNYWWNGRTPRSFQVMHHLNRRQPFTMVQREKLPWSAGNHISKPLVAVVCAFSGLKAVLCERVCDSGAKADAVEHKHTSERSDFSHITFVRVSFFWFCFLYTCVIGSDY